MKLSFGECLETRKERINEFNFVPEQIGIHQTDYTIKFDFCADRNGQIHPL
jgi:hypothetical protein